MTSWCITGPNDLCAGSLVAGYSDAQLLGTRPRSGSATTPGGARGAGRAARPTPDGTLPVEGSPNLSKTLETYLPAARTVITRRLVMPAFEVPAAIGLPHGNGNGNGNGNLTAE